jgi:hypothetical protein
METVVVDCPEMALAMGPGAEVEAADSTIPALMEINPAAAVVVVRVGAAAESIITATPTVAVAEVLAGRALC